MINMNIEIKELTTQEGKISGKIECMSRNTEPVTEEEKWLAACIFAAVEEIGKGISRKRGAKVSMIEFQRRKDDKDRN
jgi:hypothetical protein